MNKIKIEMFQNAYSNFYSLCYHYCDVYKMDKKIEIKKLYIILKICTHFGIQFNDLSFLIYSIHEEEFHFLLYDFDMQDKIYRFRLFH